MQIFSECKLCRHGLTVYNPNDMYVGKAFQLYGEFSQLEIDLILPMLARDAVVLDIGANIGALTVPMARHCSDGIVLAIEPQPVQFQFLCANIVLNSLMNARPVNAAVGSQQSQMKVPFLDPRVPNNFGGLDIRRAGDGPMVSCVTVDSMGLSKCDFIKVDVEGMEEDVLRGAMQTISRFSPLLWVESDRKEFQESLFNFLEGLGYFPTQMFTPLFNPDNYLGNPVNVWPAIVSENFLFQKPSRGLD